MELIDWGVAAHEDMHLSAFGRIITGTTPSPCLIVEEGGGGVGIIWYQRTPRGSGKAGNLTSSGGCGPPRLGTA